MTKRDLFIIALRLFGLYSAVLTLFSFIPQTVSWFLYQGLDAMDIAMVILSVVITIGLFALLILKAPWLVSVLRLDRGFDDERIALASSTSIRLFAMGVFVVGGLMFVENVPVFLSNSFFAFRGDLVGMEHRTEDNVNWFLSALNVIIGYVLVTFHERIADRLVKP